MQAEEDDSPERRELKRHLLEDDQLSFVEKSSVGFRIRLGIHDRTSATVRVKLPWQEMYHTISYQLHTTDDSSTLKASMPNVLKRLQQPERHPYVLTLAKHRAVEAMLGVRDLHTAHREKMAREKVTRELQKADA